MGFIIFANFGAKAFDSLMGPTDVNEKVFLEESEGNISKRSLDRVMIAAIAWDVAGADDAEAAHLPKTMARRPVADTEGSDDVIEADRPWGAEDEAEDLADGARNSDRLGGADANVDDIELDFRKAPGRADRMSDARVMGGENWHCSID